MYAGKTFEQLGAEELCTEDFWLEYLYYMTHTGGNKDGTISEYARKALGVAKDRFGKIAEHAKFFSVIERGGDSLGNWLKGALRQVTVAKFNEAVANGELMASQAAPIYISHREKMNRALKLHGSQDSIQRALIINCNGAACGRPGEIATLSPDIMTYDESLFCVVAHWPQMKTAKQKLVLLIAGSNRNNCVLHSFGAAFAAGCFRGQIYDDDDINSFFPCLVNAASPATLISNFMKALGPGGKSSTYSPFVVPSLPADCTAAGQRVGSITQMAQKGVSAEFAAAASGHDFEAVSTLWRYVAAELAMAVPGFRVANGHSAPPYGQLGDTPRAASWTSVLDTGGLTPSQVDDLTDLMLNIREGFSAPALRQEGRLRPFTLSLSATLVMYYSESTAANEMNMATAAMRQALVLQKLTPTHKEADARLKCWGEAIRTGFTASNLHMTGGGGASGGNEAVITTLQLLATQISSFQGTVTSALSTLQHRVGGLQDDVTSLDGRLMSLAGALSNRAPRSPMRIPASDLVEEAKRASSTEMADKAGVVPTGEVPVRGSTGYSVSRIAPSSGGGASEDASKGTCGLNTGALSATASLKWFAGAGIQATAKGLTAADYYEQVVMGCRPVLPASDHARAAFVENTFKAVATPTERRLLAEKTTPEVEKSKTIRALHDRVIARHIYAYTSASKPVPPTLQTWKELTINSLTDRTGELDKAISGQNFKARFVVELSPLELAGLPVKQGKGPLRKQRGANAPGPEGGTSDSSKRKLSDRAVSDSSANFESPSKRASNCNETRPI